MPRLNDSTWPQSPLRDRARATGPTPHLPAHYRPWPCPPGVNTHKILGTGFAWFSAADARVTHQAQLAIDQQRDRRDDAQYTYDPLTLRVTERLPDDWNL